jgi:hypothetical protein
MLFIRLLPMVAISEVKACLPQADPHHRAEHIQSDRQKETARVEPQPIRPPARPVYGLLARFVGPGELLEAVRKLRMAGYRSLDAYSPFPIHGMDRALRLSRSQVPAFVLAGGTFGLLFAHIVQWYQSTVSYPLVVDGKPYNSYEAFVPIDFETMVLYAAIGAVVGMLAVNGLPRFYHPVFWGRSFARASDDGFFLSVESQDQMFDRAATPALLADLGATEVQFLRT